MQPPLAADAVVEVADLQVELDRDRPQPARSSEARLGQQPHAVRLRAGGTQETRRNTCQVPREDLLRTSVSLVQRADAAGVVEQVRDGGVVVAAWPQLVLDAPSGRLQGLTVWVCFLIFF